MLKLRKKTHKIFSTAAFTLVEVAITLAVLALLIASVTGGMHLMTLSKIYATISEFQKYQTVISAFKQKYHAFPGDMSNAASFWSSTNGDGDDAIEYSGGPGSNESLRAWQHLNQAKMLEGKYTGTGEGTGDQASIGTNVPMSGYRSMSVNAGYSLQFNPTNTVSGGVTFMSNYLVLGAATANAINTAAAIDAGHAYAIDKKSDDGLPQLGNIIMPSTNCISGAGTAAIYSPSNTSGCVMYIRVELQ